VASETLLRQFEQDLVQRLPVPGHGAALLPDVIVENYNTELRRQGKYVGDQAAKRVFFDRLDDWRATLRKRGEDPLGDTPSEALSKKELDGILSHGDPVAAGIVQSAIEDFAKALTQVIRIFHQKAWQRVSHIVVGGGFRGSRVGELAIGRAQILLQEAGEDLTLLPIRHDPDEAGLIGAAYLLPRWMFAAFDAILAVDIGGTNVRCGIVRFESRKDPTPSVERLLLWRHGDEDPSREDVLQELISMLRKLIGTAQRRKLKLAPFIGVGCPGRVRLDGRIEQGTGNLPGNWQAKRFHLPSLLQQALPEIGGQRSIVLLHNDAVVQGLSALPEMREAQRWAVLTIGTGLGNAQFQNVPEASRKA
jgi:predicted NBD/HSP70 family sugar kinase